MSRCLAQRALERLLAGGGSDAQRAHLETCVVCAERYRRLVAELDTISYVLRETDEPRARVPARRRSLVPIAMAATAFVAVVALGSYVAVRPPLAPPRGPSQRDEATAYLRDVSYTMFSVSGQVAPSLPEVLVAELSTAGEPGCEWPEWAATNGCDEDAHVDRLLDLFRRPDTDG